MSLVTIKSGIFVTNYCNVRLPNGTHELSLDNNITNIITLITLVVLNPRKNHCTRCTPTQTHM